MPTFPSGNISVRVPTRQPLSCMMPTTPGSVARRSRRAWAADGAGVVRGRPPECVWEKETVCLYDDNHVVVWRNRLFLPLARPTVSLFQRHDFAKQARIHTLCAPLSPSSSRSTPGAPRRLTPLFMLSARLSLLCEMAYVALVLGHVAGELPWRSPAKSKIHTQKKPLRITVKDGRVDAL